jgi:hypothetical protein
MLALAGCRSNPNAVRSEEELLQQKIATLTLRGQVLTADLTLAKNPIPYLSIDGANKKLDLKAKGKAIRSFGLGRIQRAGGNPSAVDVWTKTDLKPLQQTERTQLVPGAGESTTSSIATKAPWGPQRMPADYDLICKGNLVLEIRSLASEQSRNRFTRWFVSGYRRVRDWGREVFQHRNAEYKERIEIWMNEDDAKLLFWSLPKQFDILLVGIQ